MARLKLAALEATKNEVEEFVDVLGISVPVTPSLPFGARMRLADLQTDFDDGKIGSATYFMQVFCLFTWRLPKRDRVTWEWLREQEVGEAELKAIIDATNDLLGALGGTNDPEDEDEGGKAKAPAKGRKSKLN